MQNKFRKYEKGKISSLKPHINRYAQLTPHFIVLSPYADVGTQKVTFSFSAIHFVIAEQVINESSQDGQKALLRLLDRLESLMVEAQKEGG